MRTILKYTFGGILILNLLLARPYSIAEAQIVAISQNPSYIEIVAKPGATINNSFVIGNVGDNQALKTSIHNFDPKNPAKNIQTKLIGPIRFELKNKDIDLDKPFFITEKKGRELILEIRIPENTPDGDYYYSLTTTHETGRIPEGTTSVTHELFVNSIIAITATTDGNVEQNGGISAFSINAPSSVFQTREPVPFRLVAQNNGKNMIKTHGYIYVKGPFVNKRIPLVDENIFAGSSKQLTTHSGVEIKGFFVGRYTIDAFVDVGGRIITARTTFIAVPTMLLIFLAIMAILLLIGRKIFLKSNPKGD